MQIISEWTCANVIRLSHRESSAEIFRIVVLFPELLQLKSFRDGLDCPAANCQALATQNKIPCTKRVQESVLQPRCTGRLVLGLDRLMGRSDLFLYRLPAVLSVR